MTFDQSFADGESGDTESADNGAFRQVGAQLGEFQLLRRLGRGGMAEVWLAEQTTLKRNVALKLLRSELMEDETNVKRFQAEAKAAAGLNHPNIVQVYTVGVEKGQHFIAQEYVQGQTLKALLQKRGPLDLPLALMIMRQVASALQAAAERGIVHRDIKPENIMLTRKGEVKVADFGLAQLQGGDRLNLTQEGITMGTPLYMSPEQISGQPLDQRSDIYSFGVTCYHMLAGALPFQAENAVSVAVKHLHDVPEPLEGIRPDLPPAIWQMIQRMIAKRPEQRYQDAQSIVNDVRKLAKAIRTGESVEDFKPSGDVSKPGFPVPEPALALTLLCLAVFLLSAGMGWAWRPVPQPNPDAIGRSVTRLKSAEEQYLDAMFKVDDENAFRAVITYFPARDDAYWQRLANEQLALLYLKDKRRVEQAKVQLENLRKFEGGSDAELAAEARIGEVYLEAVNGNLAPAKRALAENDANRTFDQLSGSWRQLYDDVSALVRRADAGRNNETPAAPLGP